jgi:hypothetical protein
MLSVMKKINAYTLMELIVVMVTSIIVITLAYKVFDLISHQYLQFVRYNESVYEVYQASALMATDFRESEYIVKNPEGVTCVYKNKEIVYNIGSNITVRSVDLVRDTFRIKAENVRYYFSDKEVIDVNKYVDQIKFEDVEKSELFHYQKIYAADFFMRDSTLIQYNERN